MSNKAQSIHSKSLTFMQGLLKPTVGKVGVGILVAILLLVFVGSVVVPYSPYAVTGPANGPPTLQHPFGTDF